MFFKFEYVLVRIGFCFMVSVLKCVDLKENINRDMFFYWFGSVFIFEVINVFLKVKKIKRMVGFSVVLVVCVC